MGIDVSYPAEHKEYYLVRCHGDGQIKPTPLHVLRKHPGVGNCNRLRRIG